jgi:nucleoside-diphosphate-sugar epimerase
MGPPTACVTGASGYVASELIKQLLSRGYAVKATVRSAPDSPRLQYLRDIADKSEGTLELVQVPDLEHASEALDSALQGASYVFHVASPFRFDGEFAVALLATTGNAMQGCAAMFQSLHLLWSSWHTCLPCLACP